MNLVLLVVGILTIYASLRVITTEDKSRRLPFLNAMNFGVTALIALALQHPLSGIVALLYFIFSTLESNAIASAIEGIGEIK